MNASFDDRPGFHSEINWVNGPGVRNSQDPGVRRRAGSVAAGVVLARWRAAGPGSAQWNDARDELREALCALGLGEDGPAAGPTAADPTAVRIPGQGR